MNAFKNLWSFFNKQDKIFFFFFFLMSIIQAFLEMIGLFIIIPFITFLLKPEELMKYDFLNNYINLDSINFQSDFLLIFCIVFFLIFLIKNFFIVFSTKLVFKFIYNFRNNLYLKLLKNILHQNYNFYMENNTSKISNILNTQIDTYTLYVLRPIIFFVSELIIFLGIFLLIILGGFFDSLLFMIPILLFSILILKRINRSIKSWSIIRINENQKLTKVKVLPDGNADFTRAMGMLVNKKHVGFGLRSWRYCTIINDGTIEKWWQEDGMNNDGSDLDPYVQTTPENCIEYLSKQ